MAADLEHSLQGDSIVAADTAVVVAADNIAEGGTVVMVAAIRESWLFQHAKS